MHTTLIDPATLAAHLDDPSWAVIDCRYDLADEAKGERQYREGHIPGARYAHLGQDLAGAKTGTNGRHPLPSPEEIRARFSALGIGPDTQVVAYDADTSMYAVRLWWMLRWLGHDAVAVLDGGLARWMAEGRPVRDDEEQWRPASFTGTPREGWRLTVDDVASRLGDRSAHLVDARSPERYRGENETIDPVGGHIPGAANRYYLDNLTGDKTFKSPDELRAEWARVLDGRDPGEVVMYCGSGVTACHNLLALEHAGLPGARIFPGSWSEWCADPTRPVETGERG
jgi:thiosulfate/3-mercaptopyruvate sulfurtransferase